MFNKYLVNTALFISFIFILSCSEKKDTKTETVQTNQENTSDQYPEMDHLMYLRSVYYETEAKLERLTSYNIKINDPEFDAVELLAYYEDGQPVKLVRTEFGPTLTKEIIFYILHGDVYFVQQNEIEKLNDDGDVMRTEIRSYLKDGDVFFVLRKEKEIKAGEEVDMDKAAENKIYTYAIPNLNEWTLNYLGKYWHAQHKIEQDKIYSGLNYSLSGGTYIFLPETPIKKNGFEIIQIHIESIEQFTDYENGKSETPPFYIIATNTQKGVKKTEEITVKPDYYLVTSDTVIFKGQAPVMGSILFFGKPGIGGKEENLTGRFIINNERMPLSSFKKK